MQEIEPTHDQRPFTPVTLGTVQLGQPYGISNKDGMPDPDEAMAILDTAWSAGVRTLDTAPAYGEAEKQIAQWMEVRRHRPFIVTKVSAVTYDRNPDDAVRDSVDESMTDLGVNFLDGLMMHNAQDISAPGVADTLIQLIEDGSIGGFGISAYQVEDVDTALGVSGLSMIQIPLNLFDRRMEASGILDLCASRGVVVFARSLFLQGLFFLDPETLPDHLSQAGGPLRDLRALAHEIGRCVSELAIVAARDTPGVSSLVIGAERSEQAREAFHFADAPPLSDSEREAAFSIGRDLPEEVYHPGLWR